MQISSRQGKFEPMRVDYSARSGGLIGVSFLYQKNIFTSAAMGYFSKGPKNEFETAVVNEPSVFEPLKFYCISRFHTLALFGLAFMYSRPVVSDQMF